jgi:alkyl hydroperoxide reductase subunit AhpC
MLTVGDRLPAFRLAACVERTRGREFREIGSESFPGKWLVLVSWPFDFTSVCSTEVAAFGRREGEFAERGAQVLGLSLDSQFVHLAWRREHEEIRDAPFPLLADVKRELTTALGILHPAAGAPLRATFLVDPNGVIRHVSVNDLSVGRSVDEVLRTLNALRTDKACPCDWKPGQPVLGG